jgi:tetratricopeptide (TPR) repeat protein
MKRLPALALCLLALACDRDGGPVNAATGAEKDRFAAVAALVKAKDTAGAIQALEAMRRTQPDDPGVALRLMELYNRQNEPAKAILRGRDALAAHPDAKELYVPLAELYLRAAQHELALPVLLEARARGVDDKEVAYRLGTVYANLDRRAEARAEYERALAAGLEERLGKYNLALLALADQDRPRAQSILEDVVAKNPGYAAAKRELAHVVLDQAIIAAREEKHVEMAAVNKAMDMLWGIKDELKDDWRVCEAMGDGWLLLGDYDASLAAYTEALRLGREPKSVQDRYRVAALRKKEVDAQKAAADGTKAPDSKAAAPNATSPKAAAPDAADPKASGARTPPGALDPKAGEPKSSDRR